MPIEYPQPQKVDLDLFIIETNSYADIPLTLAELTQTFTKQANHPGASGHFAAIAYGFKLIQSNFPYKHPLDYSDEPHADRALYWLRELHAKLTKPIAKYAEFTLNFDSYMRDGDCGQYRLVDATIGLDRHMPPPTAIKPLMAGWYIDLCKFHSAVQPFLERTGDIDPYIDKLVKYAEKAATQLCCIHPFIDANGRSARLVENLLRLRWGLPWKPIKPGRKQEYVNKIMNYEDSPEWQNILASHRS